jgi:protein O-GlcNAc transferase
VLPCERLDKLEPGDRSSLHYNPCSKDLQFCLAKIIQLDSASLAGRVEQENLKYRMDIFHAGAITVSGCNLDTDNLGRQLELMSPLQSWAPELQNLRQSDENTRDACDITIDTPTYVVKLDASVNMYHHFCDFSFSSLPLMDLNSVAGKKVCLKEVMFPLLPRMMFGLFYNTPVVSGCHSSELFRSFSECNCTLHHCRLNIPVYGLLPHQRMRVSIISRDTRYRRVTNEGELVKALEHTGLYKVTLARYSPHIPR